MYVRHNWNRLQQRHIFSGELRLSFDAFAAMCALAILRDIKGGKLYSTVFYFEILASANFDGIPKLNLPLMGGRGGGLLRTPSVFPDCQKTAVLRFLAHLGIRASFPHMLWKFQTQFTQGQITRLRQVTLPHTKLMIFIARPTERLPWNFQRLIQETVSIKCIPQNCDIGDLRSGQFLWPLRYKSMRENWKAPVLDGNHSKHSQTSGYR